MSDLQLRSLQRRVKIFAFFKDFEKLSRRSLSVAQRHFYKILQTILLTFNHQKLNRFEGFAHGEN